MALGVLIHASDPVSPEPTSDFTVGLHLDEYYVRMYVSTEHDVNHVLPGWVDVNDMRVGETVLVEVTSTSSHGVYAGADPPNLRFERDGRQYFNLTITMLEDSSLDEVSHLIVSADGRTYIDYATASVELEVEHVYEISATALVTRNPTKAEPGEETLGVLMVTNTGTIYGEYHLEKVSDPDSVVDEIVFARSREVELTPGFYEDFEFRIKISDDAPPGKHEITVDLWATTQYDTGDPMDTFAVEVIVAEAPHDPTSIILPLIIIITAIAVVVVVIRRRR